jgi:predicted ATPase
LLSHKKALGFRPHWTIDQSSQGTYYLKFSNDDKHHSIDGMGDGIVSLFSIVDALSDSKPGDIIVNDKPELSLHPGLQKMGAGAVFRVQRGQAGHRGDAFPVLHRPARDIKRRASGS